MVAFSTSVAETSGCLVVARGDKLGRGPLLLVLRLALDLDDRSVSS